MTYPLPDATPSAIPEDLYLDLLKKCLTRSAFPGFGTILPPRGSLKRVVYNMVASMLRKRSLAIVKTLSRERSLEPDAQSAGETMMGMERLNNIQHCVAEVLRHNVPGDFIETGVWRGGGVIFMRAMLNVYGDRSRTVWVADSFEGVPPPNPDVYAHDAGDVHWKHDYLAVSLDDVKDNFRRYGLLDEQVRFLKGWFRDTLPTAPIQQLAVLRLDGDIYESTMDALVHMYPRVSAGGYVIVDDYGAIAACRAAVDEYRALHHIEDPMHLVHDRQKSCVYWKKQTAVAHAQRQR
jgi:O-methyltransferase